MSDKRKYDRKKSNIVGGRSCHQKKNDFDRIFLVPLKKRTLLLLKEA